MFEIFLFANLFFFDFDSNNNFNSGDKIVNIEQYVNIEQFTCPYGDNLELGGGKCGFVSKEPFGSNLSVPDQIDGKQIYFEEMVFKKGFDRSSKVFILEDNKSNKILLKNKEQVKEFEKKGYNVYSLTTLDIYQKQLILQKLLGIFGSIIFAFMIWLIFFPKKRIGQSDVFNS